MDHTDNDYETANASDGELFTVVARSHPDNPSVKDVEAYCELLNRGFDPSFIAMETDRERRA